MVPSQPGPDHVKRARATRDRARPRLGRGGHLHTCEHSFAEVYEDSMKTRPGRLETAVPGEFGRYRSVTYLPRVGPVRSPNLVNATGRNHTSA